MQDSKNKVLRIESIYFHTNKKSHSQEPNVSSTLGRTSETKSGLRLNNSIVDSVLKSNPEIKAGKGLRFHVQKIHFRVVQTENIESAAMKRRRIKV